MHNNYIFQTYGDVVYYDYILNGENDDIKVENVEVYHRKDSFSIGSGSIVVKNSDLINMETNFNVNIILENKISRKSNKSDLEDDTKAKLIINNNGKTINELNLKILPVEQLEGANKEYRIENASISNQMMRLGSLKTTDEQIIKKYPNISLEYRYLKDEKLNKDNDDNYIVFKKISGKSKELVNSNDYGLFYLNEGNFKNKNLSVVIIFSNNDDKYVFSIDLTIQQVGDYYG